MRLVQLRRAGGARRVAMVEGPDGRDLRILSGPDTIYALASAALDAGVTLRDVVGRHASSERVAYDEVYAGAGEWRILPVVDHPHDPARLLVSGTGLTHRRSADQRQSMHAADAAPTDSFRMYELGVEGGRPAPGQIGSAPEWFYKGNGTLLRGHNDTLSVPSHAEDGGEEPEIAGVYLIDKDGTPRRLGMAAGNEFSDHLLERRNYLYLAASKLRESAVGPELVLDPDFQDVSGEVAIERAGRVLWSRAIRTGEAAMCHSLQNMEHHHFKFDTHRRPGDLHVHYFGADAFSFGAGLVLQTGDVMRVQFEGFGRALRNPLAVHHGPARLVVVPPA
jgi:hypothetical protein